MGLPRGLCGFLSGVALGALIVLSARDFGSPQPASCPTRVAPCRAGAAARDPAALGEDAHELSGAPWPPEFRTWLVDAPGVLPEIFRDRAMILGTDKTTTHRYHYMYAKYLLPVRHRELKLLEIGLGCDTAWGAGHSVDLWHELLPRMTYFSIELDRGCASQFIPRLGRRQFIGSQDDANFLYNTVFNETGPLDVIIDDGSHYTEHQRATFLMMWGMLKPGGLYVIEDLQCTFLSGYHGEHTGMRKGTSARLIVDIVLALLGRRPIEGGDEMAYEKDVVENIISVDVFRESVVFVKGPKPEGLKTT